jgi:hypothetical protein
MLLYPRKHFKISKEKKLNFLLARICQHYIYACQVLRKINIFYVLCEKDKEMYSEKLF